MDQTVKFTPLDMQKWPRGQMFYYFSKWLRPDIP